MGDAGSAVTVLRNCRAAAMTPTGDGAAYGMINQAAIAIAQGCIEWAGPESELPASYRTAAAEDLHGRLVTPALIDCHTHVVFGGDRAREFEQRLNGATYEQIAKAGGGINSTMAATRAASEDQLLASALPRVDALIDEGVATIEVKSGYGLDIETELRMLRAARRIAEERPIEVRTSFLGAHAIPPEFKGDPDGYIDQICLPALEAAHMESLVDAVDGFCEGIAFSPEQIERVFTKARALGLPVKLHAEQLSHMGGIQLAAQYGAISADHVEYAADADAEAMAKSGTVAVLLPGAYYTLRENQRPPIESFRKHGVRMAIATDCNPGSSPLASLLLALNMGCTLFRLTPEEALAGATRHAAQALKLSDRGAIAPGLRADLAIWNAEAPAELAYRIGFNSLHRRIFGGAL